MVLKRRVKAKGIEGQRVFRHLLEERDWIVTQTANGVSHEDLVATDPDGTTWSIEVKDWTLITPQHRAQAREQASRKKLRWMLANHIHGTQSWLVQRQGCLPVIWHERKTDD